MEDAETNLRRFFGLVRGRIAVLASGAIVVVFSVTAILLVVAPVHSATNVIVVEPLYGDLPGRAAQAAEGEAAPLTSETLVFRVVEGRLAATALPPHMGAFPNTAILLAIGVLAGLGIGVAASVARESITGGFTSEEQIEANLKTRVAATIPRLKLQPGNDTLADLVITAPLSRLAEAMRRTRIAIDQALQDRGDAQSGLGCVAMVTSALPGEGKTTAAMALARSYALSGRRTLLIDCDLRQPAIAMQLNLKPHQGLIELLESPGGSLDLGPMLQHETDTGLSLLLSTQGTERPRDTLLASAQFAHLLVQAREMFEIVLLDTPPIEPVVDALYLAPCADVTLVVTRYASTSRRRSNRVLTSLFQARNPSAQIIGILNGKDEPRAERKQDYKRFYDADYA